MTNTKYTEALKFRANLIVLLRKKFVTPEDKLSVVHIRVIRLERGRCTTLNLYFHHIFNEGILHLHRRTTPNSSTGITHFFKSNAQIQCLTLT